MRIAIALVSLFALAAPAFAAKPPEKVPVIDTSSRASFEKWVQNSKPCGQEALATGKTVNLHCIAIKVMEQQEDLGQISFEKPEQVKLFLEQYRSAILYHNGLWKNGVEPQWQDTATLWLSIQNNGGKIKPVPLEQVQQIYSAIKSPTTVPEEVSVAETIAAKKSEQVELVNAVMRQAETAESPAELQKLASDVTRLQQLEREISILSGRADANEKAIAKLTAQAVIDRENAVTEDELEATLKGYVSEATLKRVLAEYDKKIDFLVTDVDDSKQLASAAAQAAQGASIAVDELSTAQAKRNFEVDQWMKKFDVQFAGFEESLKALQKTVAGFDNGMLFFGILALIAIVVSFGAHIRMMPRDENKPREVKAVLLPSQPSKPHYQHGGRGVDGDPRRLAN